MPLSSQEKSRLLDIEDVRHLLEFERDAHFRLLGESSPLRRKTLYSEIYAQWPALMTPFNIAQRGSNAEQTFGYSDEHLRWFTPWLRDANALEVGCGLGAATRALSSFCNSVVGIDVSEGLIAQARLGATAGVRFLCADATDRLPMESGSFDVVYWNDVAEHLHPDDLRSALREIARVLRPGGALCTVTCHAFDGPHDASILVQPLGAPSLGVHLQEFTYRSWGTYLASAGFRGEIPRVGINLLTRLHFGGRTGCFGTHGLAHLAEMFPPLSQARLIRWSAGTNVVCSVAFKG